MSKKYWLLDYDDVAIIDWKYQDQKDIKCVELTEKELKALNESHTIYEDNILEKVQDKIRKVLDNEEK